MSSGLTRGWNPVRRSGHAPTLEYAAFIGAARTGAGLRSQLDCQLPVLAELRLLSRQFGFGELEGCNRGARRSIPQFRGKRFDPQQAHIAIVRAARPPHLIGFSPD